MMKKESCAEIPCENSLSRRDFLALSQRAVLSASVLSLYPFSLRASDLDTLKLQFLDSSDGLMLASVSRLLFPHHSLPDSVYLQVVQDIDKDMDANDDTRTLIAQASNSFNNKAGEAWLTLEMDKQIELLQSLQGSELFSYMHNRTIESLYRNPEVWKLLGYQGSSIEYGGYLHRGFDDIDWLED